MQRNNQESKTMNSMQQEKRAQCKLHKTDVVFSALAPSWAKCHHRDSQELPNRAHVL